MQDELHTPIEKQLVKEKNRPEFLPKYCGSHFLQFETSVFSFAGHFCHAYQGGYWEFYTLSNGGFYMQLVSKDIFSVTNDANYFSGELSADAYSIGINLYALNALLQKHADNQLIEHYYALRDFAIQHKEASAILSFID